MTAALALQKFIYETLVADPALTALIGAGRVFDDPPARIDPPYLVVGPWTVAELGSSTEAGEEHSIDLVLWSSAHGRLQVTQAAGAVRTALAGAAGSLDPPWTLAMLQFASGRIERDIATRFYRAALRFRAVTEGA